MGKVPPNVQPIQITNSREADRSAPETPTTSPIQNLCPSCVVFLAKVFAWLVFGVAKSPLRPFGRICFSSKPAKGWLCAQGESATQFGSKGKGNSIWPRSAGRSPHVWHLSILFQNRDRSTKAANPHGLKDTANTLMASAPRVVFHAKTQVKPHRKPLVLNRKTQPHVRKPRVSHGKKRPMLRWEESWSP